MGRRNDGLLVALVTLSARLPWWVGVGLALASYLICHHYASQPLPTTTDVGQLGQVGVRMMGRTLAQFGQYLLPLAFLFGAGVSWYRRPAARSRAATPWGVGASPGGKDTRPGARPPEAGPQPPWGVGRKPRGQRCGSRPCASDDEHEVHVVR